MTYLERLIAHSPWWTEPEWARDDRSLKSARLSKFSFRHLSRELRRPENLPPGSVSIVRGPRQVGKTTELKLLVEDLLFAGIPPRNIAYYPCDDIIHFRELMDMIKTFAGAVRLQGGCGYLMLDEITAVKDWTRAVKSLVDAGALENIYLLLTGSSAVEIKRGYERMPGRRGHGFDRAFLPMSFADFCRAFNLTPPQVDLTNILTDESSFRMYEMEIAGDKNKLDEILKKYLQWGGFPMVVADLVRPLANTWADLGSLEGLYYFRSRKGKEVDFVHFITPNGDPFGVEVKYQSRVSGWDEQSISKGIGQGALVTRDSFKWNKVCHIPLPAFLLLESKSYLSST